MMIKKISMKYFILNILLVASFIALSFYFLSSLDDAHALQQEKSEVAEVQVINPEPLEQKNFIVLNARLEANKEAQIFAKASGFVEERLVDIGDTVQQGQILLRLSAPEAEANLTSQKANLSLAQSELALAQSNLKRAEALAQSDIVSKAALDKARAEEKVKSQMVEARKAEVLSAQAGLNYLIIKAPFSGMITERNIEKGDKVSPSDLRPLYRILNKEKMRLVVDIPQTQFFDLDFSAPAEFKISGLQELSYKALFDRKAQNVSAQTGSIRAEYILENPSSDFVSGLNGSLNIPTKPQNGILVLPNNVLINEDGQNIIFIVNDKNILEKSPVTLGRSFSNDVEILSGIKEQDKVVLNPNALLQAGDKVIIKEKVK